MKRDSLTCRPDRRETGADDRRAPCDVGPRYSCRAARQLALVLLTFGLTTGCAGYRWGQRTLYRPDIRSVHVPVFQSDSFRRNLGERLTEAVVKEIQTKTPYRLASAETADSVLRGRIISETKRVIAENYYDNPRLVETDFVVPSAFQLVETMSPARISPVSGSHSVMPV